MSEAAFRIEIAVVVSAAPMQIEIFRNAMQNYIHRATRMLDSAGQHVQLTSVSVVLLIVGYQQSIILAGDGLLSIEVLVFDLGKLDHLGGCRKMRLKDG